MRKIKLLFNPAEQKEMTEKQNLLRMESTLLAGTNREAGLEERKMECVQRFTDLGLGRGIDATSSKPWQEKSSFQVRKIKFNNIVGTEEGGAVEAYENIINSVQTLQLSLKSSITAPHSTAPVKIGIDGETSRTVSSNRRVVGKRVVNRTISFREEFKDLPTLCSIAMDQKVSLLEEDRSISWSFEERLCSWILETMHGEYPDICGSECHKALQEGTSPSKVFSEWFKKTEMDNMEMICNLLAELCYKFVVHFHITHYVSAVVLGALEFKVMSEQEYFRTISQANSLGVDNMASGEVKAKHILKKLSKHSHTKELGCIKDSGDERYLVPRGTYSEAVIETEFKPITSLLYHSQLRHALKRATSTYIDQKGDSSVGPFFIAAISRKGEYVYFSVDEGDMTLQVTKNKKLASVFFIILSEERCFDFHIIYLRDTGSMAARRKSRHILFADTVDSLRPLPYYLATPLSFFGWNSAPLTLELNPERTNTLFHLHNRLKSRNPPPEGVESWVQGREAFAINCYGRKWAFDGYLAVERMELSNQEVDYQPLCVPSLKYSSNYYMVFKVFPVSGNGPSSEDELAEKGSQYSGITPTPSIPSLDILETPPSRPRVCITEPDQFTQ